MLPSTNSKVTSLNWDVFIAPGIPIRTSTPAPNIKETFWHPISSTLIYGEHDAVLVDTFLTVGQSNDLVNWVAASGKNLTTIYITHGHGDHCLGIGALLDRFANAKAVATPGTVRVMREALSDRMTLWNGWLPGQIPNHPVIAEELEGNAIDLEGNELRVVELGHSDTLDTTCLYIPSIGLAVVGDAAFNGTHPWLAGCPTPQKRKEWMSALNKIESLNPRAVIAGHKQPGKDDDPRIIEETRQYIRDFDKLAESAKTARELYDQMLKLYPDWLDPHVLWLGARAAKGEGTVFDSVRFASSSNHTGS
jgi:glyoxylase-like metal-dependent hydrolase (beta-lactamase superfamily II)